MVPSQATYTMGSGGDLNTTRPTKIEDNCFIRYGTLDFPLQNLNFESYAAIVDKTTQSNLPTRMFFDNTVSSVSEGVGVDIQSGRQLVFRECSFESNGEQAIYVHPTTIAATNVPAEVICQACWFEDNWSGDGSQATKYAVDIDATGTTAVVDATFRDTYFAPPSLFLQSNATRLLKVERINMGPASNIQANNLRIGGSATDVTIEDWNVTNHGAVSTTIAVFNSATLAANVKINGELSGTWTVTDQSGAALSLTQEGTWIKVGKLVHVQANITFPATVDATANSLGGLPFTSKATTPASGLAVGYSTLAALSSCVVDTNATTFSLRSDTGGTLTNGQLTGATFWVSGTYEASA
jgi:hypothetical protein